MTDADAAGNGLQAAVAAAAEQPDGAAAAAAAAEEPAAAVLASSTDGPLPTERLLFFASVLIGYKVEVQVR